MMRRGSNVEEDMAYEIRDYSRSTNARTTPFGKIIGRTANCSSRSLNCVLRRQLSSKMILAYQQEDFDVM